MSIDYNNVFREGFLTGLDLIPEVGGFASYLGKLLWPEDESNPLADLEAKLEQLSVQIEDQVWITTLEGLLDELRQTLYRVANPQSQNDKYAALNLLYSDSTKFYDHFVNPNKIGPIHYQPQNTVPLLVAFGTIRLVALVERVNHYEVLVGDTPDVPPVNELRQNLQEMSAKVTTDRAAALAWRQAQLSISTDSGIDIGNAKTWYRWTARDALDSNFTREYSAEDDSPTQNTGDVHARLIQYVNNRRFTIGSEDGGYASNLDKLLDAWRFWKYSDPDVPKVPTPGYRYWCNLIGGGVRTGDWFNDKNKYIQYGDLKAISWWWDNGALKGIMTWYGDQPWFAGNAHGSQNGTQETVSVVPSQDGIISMAFSSGDWVDKFTVDSNSRALANMPGPGRTDYDTSWGFPASASFGSSSSRLAYIAGVTNGDVISQLKIVWKTGEEYTTDLPTEHTAQAINDGYW